MEGCRSLLAGGLQPQLHPEERLPVELFQQVQHVRRQAVRAGRDGEPDTARQGERLFPEIPQPVRRRVRPREVLKVGDVFRILRPFVRQPRLLLRKRTRKPAASVFAAERAAAGPLAAVPVRARKTAVEGEFRDPSAELLFQIGTYGVVVDAAEDIFQIEGSV